MQSVDLINKEGHTYLAIGQNKRTNKVTGIESWEKAFRVYIALYTRKYPHRAAELMQYGYTIQLAANKYSWDNVAYYDHVFRQNMAKNPDRSWGKTYNDLWNIAMCDLKSVAGTSSTGGKKGVAYCWKFNKGMCKNQHCRFEHKCNFCGGTSHGANTCYKKHGKSHGKPHEKGKPKGNNSAAGGTVANAAEENTTN